MELARDVGGNRRRVVDTVSPRLWCSSDAYGSITGQWAVVQAHSRRFLGLLAHRLMLG